MRTSILGKMFGGYAVLLLVFSLVFSAFSFQTIKKFHLTTLTQELEKLGLVLGRQVAGELDEGNAQNLESLMRDLARTTNVRLTVVDVEGQVVAESELEPSSMESHRFRPEIQEALAGRVGRALRFSSSVKKDMLYVALPLRREGRIIGALRLSLFVPEIKVLLARIRTDLWRAVAILTAVFLIAAFLFSRHLAGPLKSLVIASERVAAGDFDSVVRVRRSDEWQELARSFNAMTANLKAMFVDLRQKREELDRIIASMEEGVLFLDPAGRIVLVNETMKELVGQDIPPGKYFWEVLRLTPFVDLVRKVRQEKHSLTTDLSWGEKRILCRATYLPLQEGVVVTFSDISEADRLAQVKKDLVLHVSHELRTPLAAIRGYAETLEAEVSKEHQPYVETILRHTDRLIKIVDDLLVLAALEEKVAGLEIQEVDLRELARAVVRIFEPKAREKNLNLGLLAEDDLPSVEGDPFRLEQLLVNLVDNAVKYTEKGSIEVRLKRTDNQVTIEVADTGLGIPEEARDRIFERFYVVDPSRSRKLGGTGLGLSIVKHIALQHGGRVEVESVLGRGSIFRVHLPLKNA